jgi:nitrate reductase gamma subunit
LTVEYGWDEIMGFSISLLALVILIALPLAVAGAGWHVLLGVVIPYVAVGTFILGIILRVVKWARSPVPFRIVTTCGQQRSLPWIKGSKLESPAGTLGVIGRMALEVLFFRSLFRNTGAELKSGPRILYGSNKWLWLGGMAFHWSFLIILLRHLRFFSEPVPSLVLWLQDLDGFFQIGVPFFLVSDLVLTAAVGFLLLRRLVSPRIRYISLAADYFPLLLILGIATTGVLMRYLLKTDLVAVKELAMRLVLFEPKAVAGLSPLFYTHLFLVSVLVAYFPFSKLMHMGGIFLSPTRNLANNSRAVRHINPWNYPVKVHTYEEWEDEFRDKLKGAGMPVERES